MDEKDKKLENEYIEKIEQECKGFDQESDHVYADNLLCELLKELGFNNLVKRYEEIPKWYA